MEENQQYWDDLLTQQKLWNGRRNQLLSRYGITLEYFDILSKKQGNMCAICKNPPTHKWGVKKELILTVDMDISTKTLRGLLCRDCKCAITYLKESPTRAAALVEYLTIPQSSATE